MSETCLVRITCDICSATDDADADVPVSTRLSRLGWLIGTNKLRIQHMCDKCVRNIHSGLLLLASISFFTEEEVIFGNEMVKTAVGLQAPVIVADPGIPAGYIVTEHLVGGQTRYGVVSPRGASPLGTFPTKEAAIDFCVKDAAKVVTVVDGMRIVTPAGGVVTRQHVANLSFDKGDK